MGPSKQVYCQCRCNHLIAPAPGGRQVANSPGQRQHPGQQQVFCNGPQLYPFSPGKFPVAGAAQRGGVSCLSHTACQWHNGRRPETEALQAAEASCPGQCRFCAVAVLRSVLQQEALEKARLSQIPGGSARFCDYCLLA